MDKITELMKSLIVNICNDLKKPNKSNEMIKKYIDGKDNKNNSKNIVKKPLSSYMIFCNEMRNKIKKKYPKSSVGEISKKLGKLWKALNVKDREKYDKLHEKEQNRYRTELKNTSKTTGLLSENSLSISCINNSDISNSDEEDNNSNSLNSDDEDDNLNSDEENNKNIYDSEEESKSDNILENVSETEDEEEEDDELGDLYIKKKINLGDINNDMNSIYLDSD